MTVSPRVKLLALVGGLAAAALAAGMFFLSRTPATVDAPIPAPVHRTTKAATAGPKTAARTKPVIAPDGIPVVVMSQIAKHRVVVVSVYADDAHVDTTARDEARAGAR